MIKILENNRLTAVTDQNTVQKILEYGQDLIDGGEYYEGYSLAKELESLLAKQQGSFPELQRLINQLKIFALNFCTEVEIKDIFEKHLADGLGQEDIKPLDRLLIAVSDVPEDRQDIFKKQLMQNLTNNKQILTAGNLKRDDEQIVGTIEHWLADYLKTKGAAPVNQIEKLDYLTNSKNVRNLSQEDKDKLFQVVEVLEYLKQPSSVTQVMDNFFFFRDEDGRLKLFDKGELIDLDKTVEGKEDLKIDEFLASADKVEKQKEEVSELEQEVRQAYQGDPKQRKAIEKELSKIEGKIGSDISKLKSEFFAAVQNQNVIRTIALLLSMASKNELENFVATDEKLNKFLATIWEKQYGSKLVEEFKKNPTQPKFMKKFLQYVLEQRLLMDSNEAARIGLQVGNIIAASGKKSYNEMAYFDVNTKQFNWFD